MSLHSILLLNYIFFLRVLYFIIIKTTFGNAVYFFMEVGIYISTLHPLKAALLLASYEKMLN
jgi:hypothetical protein